MVVLTRSEVASLRPACKKERLLNPKKFERIENVLNVMIMYYESEIMVCQKNLTEVSAEYAEARSALLKANHARRRLFLGTFVENEEDFQQVIEAGERVIMESLKVESVYQKRKDRIETLVNNMNSKISVLNAMSALKADKKLDDEILRYGK